MTRLECGGARLSASLSYSCLVPSLSLSRTLSTSRHDGFLRRSRDKKVRVFLYGAPSRKIYVSRRLETATRARCPFSLLRAPLSRIAEWIVIGYNRSRCHPPPLPQLPPLICRDIQQFAIFPCCDVKRHPSPLQNRVSPVASYKAAVGD